MRNDEIPGAGHNLPPIEHIKQRTAELIVAADTWIENIPEITDEITAGKANDFLSQLRAEYKVAEDFRKKEKQPWIDGGKAIDLAYNPIKERLELAANQIKNLLTPWLVKVQKAEDEARRRREQEAKAKQQEAERLAKEAAKGGIDAEIEAEHAAKVAEAADKAAAQFNTAKAQGEIGRATGLRTIYYGEITDYAKALHEYRNDQLIIEALHKAVARDIRAGRLNIPGVERRSKQAV